MSLIERARRARELSELLFESSPIARLILGKGGAIAEANARARALGFVRGERITGRFVKKERNQLNAYLKRAVSKDQAEWCELTLTSSELSEMPVALRADAVGSRLFVGITERPTTSAQVNRRHLHRLLDAQDTERRRLSLELHDQLGQTLGALEVGLAHVAGISREAPVSERVVRLRAMVREAVLELRRLAHALYPRVLEDHGLRPALERLVSDTRAISRVRILLAADDCDLPRRAMLAVYRVVQEAVANAIRHSGARTLRIEIFQARGRVTGSIEDDGCGFALQEHAWTGLGLRSMRDRVEQLQGTFRICSRPDEGTTIGFEFLVPEEEGERR